MKQTLYELFDLLEQQHEGTISPEQKEAIDLAAPWAKRLEELAASPAEFDSIWSASMEIGQSAQPILSYNFGAGNGARVRKAFRLALLTAVAAGLGFFGLTALFSRWIVAMFIDSSCTAGAIAVRGLPLFASGFVFFAVNIVSIGYFQSVERPRPAMAVTVLRGFVFMAACFFGLPLLLGVEGIWLAVPLAEALTFAVVAAIYGRTRLKSAF